MGILLWFLMSYNAGAPELYKNEQFLGPTLALCLCGFPASLIYFGALALISEIFALNWLLVDTGNEVVDFIVFIWLPLCALAYLQWFVVLPSAYRRICSWLGSEI